MMQKYIIGAVVVLVLIILVYAIRCRSTTGYHEEYMTGFWQSDEDFAKEAGIGHMFVYFDEPDRGLMSTTRSAYVIIGPSIANEKFEMRHGGSAGVTGSKYRGWGKLTFESVPGTEAPLPEAVSMDVDVQKGRLLLYTLGDDDKKVIHARLFKQHDLS